MRFRMRCQGGESGVTMIEAMMTIGVIGFVMAVIFSVTYFGVVAFQKQFARNKLLREAQATMAIMSSKLREARAGTVSISKYLNAPDYSMITFETLESGGCRYGFYVNIPPGTRSRQLVMSEPRPSATPGVCEWSNTVLATDVCDMFFTYPSLANTSLVIANLTLRKDVTSTRARIPVVVQTKEEVFIRNP